MRTKRHLGVFNTMCMPALLPTLDQKHPHFHLLCYRHQGISAQKVSIVFSTPTLLICLGEAMRIAIGQEKEIELLPRHMLLVYAPQVEGSLVFQQDHSYELVVLQAKPALIRNAGHHLQKEWKEAMAKKMFLLTEPRPVSPEVPPLLEQALKQPEGGDFHYYIMLVMRRALKLYATDHRSKYENVQRLYEYLLVHAFDRENAAAIVANAGKLNINEREKFRLLTGTTPTQFITKLRIEKAKELLAQTNLPVKEIAAQVGFALSSYLIRTFREAVGQTPAVYRRHTKQNPA